MHSHSSRHFFNVDFVPVIESFDRDVRVPRNGDDIDLSHRLLDFGSIF